jgi:hypothetical protein
MSALGQKRTCAVQNAMSALPPKADIVSDTARQKTPSFRPEGFPATYNIDQVAYFCFLPRRSETS